MVVLDTDGVLNTDDVQDEEFLRKMQLPSAAPAGPGGLVGRPLAEVERYYIEQALALTGGKREEAARMLGIGERTLYRTLKDWELQDKARKALADSNGDVAAVARALDVEPGEMEKLLKKWGLVEGRHDEG